MTCVRGEVRIDAYRVIREAVERGATYGWYRAHKHTDKPSEAGATETIGDAVMDELCEVLVFNDEKGD